MAGLYPLAIFVGVGVFLIAVLVRDHGARVRLQADFERFKFLAAKYHDERLVNRLFKREVWRGQSAEQLRDAIGEPEAVDQQVLKTKTREIWKYGHRGGNRYTLRVIVDNAIVVGWKSNE